MLLIAGPCVIEGRGMCEQIAGTASELAKKLGMDYVFKASFDKANRSSIDSRRGVGIESGLVILGDIRKSGIKVLTDVHETTQVDEVASVVDWLQIPAFLCRQTDLIQKAAATGKNVLIKKGQFMAPQDMRYVLEKAPNAWLCERGTSFGYNNLVVDMRSLPIMREMAPVVFDATHSAQLPGGAYSDGQRRFIPHMVRAAIAVGIDGLFVETHPDPNGAWSDRATQWPLKNLESLLSQ
jgi:2-dehydro-3-deoxyphosphooctonate aldolase (KDO 8-P synthase)